MTASELPGADRGLPEVPEQAERNMAVTRIMAMHLNKGRTIAQCLKDRTDYAKTPARQRAAS